MAAAEAVASVTAAPPTVSEAVSRYVLTCWMADFGINPVPLEAALWAIESMIGSPTEETLVEAEKAYRASRVDASRVMSMTEDQMDAVLKRVLFQERYIEALQSLLTKAMNAHQLAAGLMAAHWIVFSGPEKAALKLGARARSAVGLGL